MADAAGFQARSVTIPFEHLGLVVGDSLFLESMDQGARYHVRLVGYVVGQGIILTQPLVEGKLKLLSAGRPFTVRSAARNKVFAFQSAIRHTSLQPFAHLFLEYPKELMTLEVRNAERVAVSLEAELHSDFDAGLGDWPRVVRVTDLSRTGAGVESPREISGKESGLTLRCRLTAAGVTKMVGLRCEVRGSRPVDQSEGQRVWLTGLQFTELSEAAQLLLAAFLYEASASDQGSAAS